MVFLLAVQGHICCYGHKINLNGVEIPITLVIAGTYFKQQTRLPEENI